MNSLVQDLRYALRMLVKKPGFTAVCLLTLALGTGANTAIFSVVNTVLVRPLPYPEADRLVAVWSKNLEKGRPRFGVSLHDVEDWRQQSQVFADIAAFGSRSANLTGGDEPERVEYALVNASLFRVLGTRPALGRALMDEEDQPGKDKVVVVSHAFWQRYLGGQADAPGKTLQLDGKSLTVVGVMPAGFEFPAASTQLWKPMGMRPDDAGARDGRWAEAIALLKPGVDLNEARAEMDTIARRLGLQYPATNTGWGVLLEPYRDSLASGVRQAVLVLWAAVGFVLLIACANVANLLLSRAVSREKEIAVRIALGASRLRIARQLLTEALLLSSLGGVAGLVLSLWAVDLLEGMSDSLLPGTTAIAIDGRVLAYCTGISLLTGMLFGLLPAYKASSARFDELLKEGGRASAGAGNRRARSLLVMSEVALAVVVLAGAGLMIKSFAHLVRVDPGFDPQNLLTLRVAPPWQASPEGQQQEAYFKQILAERERAAAFYNQLLERLEAMPGVESAAAINRLPLTGNWWQLSFAIENRPPPGPGESLDANGRVISPGYFSTLGIPLLSGRALTELDDEKHPAAVVISKAMAERYWPGEDPVGQRITFDPGTDATFWFTVVGVVGDVRHNRLEVAPRPLAYVSFAQARFGYFGDWGMDLVVRASSDPLGLAGAVRSQVLALDKSLPVFRVNSMQQVIASSVSEHRFNMLMLSIFAGLALLLAGVGIYGVVSYSVSQQTREIGIRLALGADVKEILKLVVGGGMALTLAGLGAGLAASFGLTRLLSSMLFGVSAADPVVFLAVSLVLAAVATVACYIPARRAMKVDPMNALRQ